MPDPDLAGEHTDAAQFDQVAEAGLGLAAGVGLEQLVGFRGGLEGQAGEGEVAQVHHSSSFLNLRMASGEGGGSGAGSPGSIRPEAVAALDGGICVGVEAGGLSGRLSVVDHVEGPAGRRPGVVAQDDVLPDQERIDLVEAAVQADGAVLVDAALDLEEEGVVEVEGGVGVAHAG